jgi:hypothetical protein
MPRPFNPEALTSHATESIRAPLGIGAVGWRYLVLVPLEEARSGEVARPIATDDDLDNLQAMLTAHFQGLTIGPPSTGYGLRAGEMELNLHHPMIVYTAAVAAAERYIDALRRELQQALDQELILVERQEVWIQ